MPDKGIKLVASGGTGVCLLRLLFPLFLSFGAGKKGLSINERVSKGYFMYYRG